MAVESQYKTLLKSDENFQRYLLGSFSSDLLALPVESFGVGTERERATFLLIPESKIEKPHWLKVYWKAIRPELLGLTLGQAVLAAFSLEPLLKINGLSVEQKSPEFLWTSFACLLVIFFTHAAACLFNDFRDHLQGLDRKSSSQGSRVIQKGWSRAFEVRRWAYVNSALALAIGSSLLWGHWFLLLGLGSLTALAVLFYSYMTPFWNRLGAGDFWITLLFGPLMYFSIWISVYSPGVPFETSKILFEEGILLSLCFGLLASWTFQVRQFQGIFKRQAGSFRTVVSRLNFDQAKTFISIEAILFFALPSFCFYWIWKDFTGALILIFGMVLSLYQVWDLYHLPSPLSSKMPQMKAYALRIHSTFLGLWLVALWLIR
ncbi:MAG TPA: hypothetical protein DCL41_01855 [Bdellovibrionales bacterium]|nr:hypothetical protein [Pseudobdellovibrionaceae bacterium]HAG90583.1 hypothetical protein [Bdellovibrionales bacterium]|tara:strand:- start:15065 stop:16192 length:1128 start_codon:yes stop_codon:yes gene_type:complete